MTNQIRRINKSSLLHYAQTCFVARLIVLFVILLWPLNI